MESEGSLPHSQQPSTGPDPDSDESICISFSPISLTPILILYSHPCLYFPSSHFPCGFTTQVLYAIIPSYYFRILKNQAFIILK
jgi:hypothetical protein